MSAALALEIASNVNERSFQKAPPHIRFVGGKHDPFRQAVAARMEAYLAESGKGRFAGAGIAVKAVFYGAAMIASYVLMLTNEAVWWKYGLFAIACGLSTLFLAISISHDAAHGALTGHRKLDSVIHRLVFTLFGVDGYLWQMRHLGSHHVFPNVNGSDIDIDENPFLRLSPNHPRKSYQRWQHIYALPAYTLTLLHSIFFGDFLYLRNDTLANMRGISHSRRDIAIFFGAKLVYFTINLVLPLLIVPLAWWKILLSYFAMSAAMSLVFVFMLVGTHFSTETQYPEPSESGEISTSWAEHVLSTSVDWLPESKFATFISGGANAHAAHHLFPRLSHRHGIAATRIIRQTAWEYGLEYHETNFSGMIRDHFRHLKNMAA